MGWFRRTYGENPLHLLALLACFALAGAAVLALVPNPNALWIAVWFAAAVIGHDLVLYPLYALADRSLVLARWVRRRVSSRPVRVAAANYVRLPVLGSLVLGLVWYPTISGGGADVLAFAAGLPPTVDYVARWLLLTAVLFLASAVAYAVALGRSAVRERNSRR
ncbi:hypothetical protein EV188_102308 [Actinomycetospora succinea]|uniref:Lipoprotein n=1 Tax=Actinomycetospora succinea TaxID=663603 RepID=A0A4V3DAK6_9PSEU|nr:hypothetical protein [Actinomycetospora succinea]TDQ62653.1 hypothetical protein EV188_102308 [Actinomycetospora succinea]